MIGFFEFADGLGTNFGPILISILIILVVYVIFSFFLGLLKKSLLKLAKTKKQISNVEIFTTAIRYIFVFLLLISTFLYYSGGGEGLALTLGLFSAAIGFALQKPISGVAAWIIIVTRRPFEIGDRIIIGNVKGDVRDISLTHITLNEIGGLVQTEESSGRRIMVPNNLLFEQNIVNYTQQDEFIMHQIIVSLTYDSDIDKGIKICTDIAKKHTKQFSESVKKEPYVRLFFQPSGVNLGIRFFVPAKRMTEFASEITRETHKKIRAASGIRFAYPHTEVLLKQKGKS